MIGTRPPFVLRFCNAAGEWRYIASVAFQRFRPTSDIAEARLMEREEVEFWAPLLRQWFPSALARVEAFESGGVGEPPGFERAVLHSECASLRQERDEARRERNELREAMRALLAYLAGDGMPTLLVCNACESRLATRSIGIGFRRQPASHRHVICDACEAERACSSEGAEVCSVTDLPIAAPLRRLREMLELLEVKP